MTKSRAIIPVRDFANTKLRLRGVLSDLERAELTSSLLDIVLHALELSKITEVTVVATDTLEVEPKLRRFSKLRIVQEVKRRGGVNNAMMQGIDSLPKSVEDSLLLLLPSDLPFLNSDTANSAISLANEFDIVINPSRKKDGTNLLLMKESHRIHLHYDDDSFVRHLGEASRSGLSFTVTEQNGFSFDVDDEEDLSLLKSEMGALTFQELTNRLRKKAQ